MRKLLPILFLLFISLYPQAQTPRVDADPLCCIVQGDTIYLSCNWQEPYEVYLPCNVVTTPEIKVLSPNGGYIIDSQIIAGGKPELLVNITNSQTIKFIQLPKLDLYLLIGQSNMAGRGYITQEYKGAIEGRYLLNISGNMVVARNPLNEYSNIRKDLSMQGVGPGYGFARKMSDLCPNPIGLVVNARGGSSINSWVKGSSDGLFEKTISRARQAERWGDFKAILWLQGEADRKYPDSYKDKLALLVSDLRKELAQEKLPFVAAEIAHWAYPESGSFNEMIQTIANFIPYSDWVSAQGLTSLINQNDPHFNSASMVTMGERFAKKVSQMLICSDTNQE